MGQEEREKKKEDRRLLKVLTAHFNSLVSAQSDETVLKEYSALLRFVKSGKFKLLGDSERTLSRKPGLGRPPIRGEEEVRNASLKEIEEWVRDAATPRKDLEFIAIQRFSVPSGSMRSFSNRQMLVDKLLTLIMNERTHQTIGAVARGEHRGDA